MISICFLLPLMAVSLASDKADELMLNPVDVADEDRAVYLMDSLKSLVADAELSDVAWNSVLKVALHHKNNSKDSSNPVHQLNIRLITKPESRSLAIKILNQYLIYLYNGMLEKFSNSIRLRISFSFFLCKSLRFHNQSLQFLYQTLLADCRSADLFRLNKAQGMVEHIISQRMSSVPTESTKSILASSKVEKIFSRIVVLTSKIAHFWRNIAASNSKLSTTATISSEIMIELKSLRKEIKLPFYQSFPPLIIAYYRFEKEALFNESLQESFLASLTEKAKTMIESFYNLENVTPESDLSQTDIGYAVLESADQKRYELLSSNKTFAKLLNYMKDEIVGTDFLVHVPKPMQGEMRSLLVTEREFSDKTVVLIMRHGCIRDFGLSIKRMTDEYDRDIAIAKLTAKPKSASSHMLLTDKSGVVTAYSTGTLF